MSFETCSRELDKRHVVYTPLIWVIECHKVMDRIFGTSWREQVVWDLSCGDRAMTRNYKFKELYSSDIRPEVEPDFVYDATILDESKMPSGLVEALEERKPIIIFTNIPFGAVGRRIRDMVNKMKKKYNARIIWACISNNFMALSQKTDQELMDEFQYLYGFMFNSTEFPELKESWPVIFSVLISRERR